MTDLSPQAQAVLDAFGKHPLNHDTLAADLLHGALPAALVAAAEQLGYRIIYDDADSDYRVNVAELLAIAAELRNATEDNQ